MRKFGLWIKGYYHSGKKREEGDSNLDEKGEMGVAEYRWDPLKDTLKVRQPLTTNGRKWRGAIIKSKDGYYTSRGRNKKYKAPELIIKTFSTKEEVTPEALEEVLQGLPKTLELIVSKTAGIFDTLGKISPLISQGTGIYLPQKIRWQLVWRRLIKTHGEGGWACT